MPMRKKRWVLSDLLNGFKGNGFGSSLKPKHAGYLKFDWRKGLYCHFKFMPNPSQFKKRTHLHYSTKITFFSENPCVLSECVFELESFSLLECLYLLIN
jgi:hypothetical protein